MNRELNIRGNVVKQRKAEFRAKRVSNNAWVYGYYYEVGRDEKTAKAFIVNDDDTYEVDPKTACQYVWRKDDKGNKIYEYDILFRHEKMSSTTYCNNGTVSVTWWDNISYDIVTPKSDNNPGWSGIIVVGYNTKMEVAGNVFDTPELMDKKTEVIRPKDTVKFPTNRFIKIR